MSPFMINIQKCFDHTKLNRNQKEQIVDDVITSISSFIAPELLNGLNQIIVQPENTTLGLERDALRQISIR